MQDLASNHIIPYMEQKIRVLNQQVFSLFHYFFLPLSTRLTILFLKIIIIIILSIFLGSHNKEGL